MLLSTLALTSPTKNISWYSCNAALFIAAMPLSSLPRHHSLHYRDAALFIAARPHSSSPQLAATPTIFYPAVLQDWVPIHEVILLIKFWGGDQWKETGPHTVDGVIALPPTDWTIRDLPYL